MVISAIRGVFNSTVRFNDSFIAIAMGYLVAQLSAKSGIQEALQNTKHTRQVRGKF